LTAREIYEEIERLGGGLHDRTAMNAAAAQAIQQDPGAVRSLVNYVGGPRPTRELGLRRMAHSIAAAEKRRAESAGERVDRGMLGLGTERRRQILGQLQSHNEMVALCRSGLGITNRHKLLATGNQRFRNDIAFKVIGVWAAQVRFANGRT
jgi:hypothetical protein